MGWVNIFFLDIFGFSLNTHFQVLDRPFSLFLISCLLGLQQALVIFLGKFRVNRHPDYLLFISILARQFNGKFHPIAAVLFGGHIDTILIRGQNLFQNMA